MKLKHTLLTFAALAASLHIGMSKPNVVFVITDDQGYGDMACHGHPYAITPNIDNLASESVGLDDYHVFPTCSPTRAAIMTGHWANRTGVWHTIMGRSMLRENEVTIGQMLQNAGYVTGMFGKWHMGDNYPFRPEDRGFTEVYRHGGGGVGQTPDLWDNAYFDGSYFHNGKIVPAKGFCTDVFFSQAKKFIKNSVNESKPFFAYISSNAPHSPLHAPQKYMDMYPGLGDSTKAFYGMVTNIDDNVGELREYLKELGVEKETIFIFTTDNGTAHGRDYGAGMRGKKGSEYEGGHRVPFFIYYPAGGLTSSKKVKTLTHAVDIAPTLLDYCEANTPPEVKFDGKSIRPLFEQGDHKGWEDRMLISDSQRVVNPIKWRKSSVMAQGWRLVNGKELYDLESDGEQRNDVAANHPERVKTMRAFYEAWWSELKPSFEQDAYIVVGNDDAPIVDLTSHDIIMGRVAWNQGHIRNLAKYANKKFNGYWSLEVQTSGTYQVTLRRWPHTSGAAINAPLPKGLPVPGASKAFREKPGDAIKAKKVVIQVDGKELAQAPVNQTDKSVTCLLDIEKGKRKLSAFFVLENGDKLLIPYADVKLIK